MRISKLIHRAVAAPTLRPGGTSPNGGGRAANAGASGIEVKGARHAGLEGLLQGRTLGDRYEILEVIGRGGMGVVYRALDRRLSREVAVKVLSASSPDGESYSYLRARFVREARAAAGIRHPKVVAVYDQGTDAALGLDFLVMELLEGEDLGTLVSKLGLPRVTSTVKLLREAAAGVAAGHRAGLVHRDIKPANLFLESRGPDVQVKVLDFGIAEAARDHEWTMAAGEGETLHALSPAFASPEQLRGDSRLTAASDVFSLGAVAHQLLTGARLWTSLDPHRALQEMEAARASFAQDRTLPLKLREVVTQALASHPEDRFRDARELLIALDDVRVSESGESDLEPGAVDVRESRVAGEAIRTHAQGIRAVVTPSGMPSRERFRNLYVTPELVQAIERIGTVFVLALVASICFLTLISGELNTVVAAIAILAATALMPVAGESRAAAESARSIALGVAAVMLLGLMLDRAAHGSVADLLFSQMIITGMAFWLSSPRASSGGKRSAPGPRRPSVRTWPT